MQASVACNPGMRSSLSRIGRARCLLVCCRYKCLEIRHVEHNIAQHAFMDRDNVALCTTLEPRDSASGPVLVVGNTHILYNTKRGDIKLAQVQASLEALHAMQSKVQHTGGAAIVFCGDFNATPASVLYHYLRTGSVNLSKLPWRHVSNQRSTPLRSLHRRARRFPPGHGDVGCAAGVWQAAAKAMPPPPPPLASASAATTAATVAATTATTTPVSPPPLPSFNGILAPPQLPAASSDDSGVVDALVTPATPVATPAVSPWHNLWTAAATTAFPPGCVLHHGLNLDSAMAEVRVALPHVKAFVYLPTDCHRDHTT